MNNYVITIGRELGSGGKTIGELMGKQLGIPVYDRRLIMMAAQESGLAPEVFEKADETPNKGMMSHIMRTLSSPFASFSSLYSNSMSKESLFQVQADIIRQKAAEESCIIVGRCSDYILREHPRHLDIFVRANFEDRVAQLMKRHGCTDKEAKELIDKIDAIRSDYHNFYAETNWGDSRAYDICVNSSILGIEGTANLLLQFVRNALNL
ncbi:MAG: cytidylate kinase-like family protein [Prevotella sp.]|nr:cytidylate kinase-like family protein [Prevotella sp.]